MKKNINGVVIECIKGNIVAQEDIAAIVNAANARLMPGGGVAGAIHRAAGPGLEKECRPLAPVSPGQAVITGGHNLPNRYVIHALGPVFGVDKPEAAILEKCYLNSLQLAEGNKIDSVAFPAISTGVFGYPPTKAAEIAIRAAARMAQHLKYVKKIRFVLFSESDLEVHKNVLLQQ